MKLRLAFLEIYPTFYLPPGELKFLILDPTLEVWLPLPLKNCWFSPLVPRALINLPEKSMSVLRASSRPQRSQESTHSIVHSDTLKALGRRTYFCASEEELKVQRGSETFPQPLSSTHSEEKINGLAHNHCTGGFQPIHLHIAGKTQQALNEYSPQDNQVILDWDNLEYPSWFNKTLR